MAIFPCTGALEGGFPRVSPAVEWSKSRLPLAFLAVVADVLHRVALFLAAIPDVRLECLSYELEGCVSLALTGYVT